jgi:hypothetical protein
MTDLQLSRQEIDVRYGLQARGRRYFSNQGKLGSFEQRVISVTL